MLKMFFNDTMHSLLVLNPLSIIQLNLDLFPIQLHFLVLHLHQVSQQLKPDIATQMSLS